MEEKKNQGQRQREIDLSNRNETMVSRGIDTKEVLCMYHKGMVQQIKGFGEIH